MPNRFVILAYARTWEGSDDYALIKSFRRLGHSVTCIDDEKYVLPRWEGTIPRAIRKLLRGVLVGELNREFVRWFDKIKPDAVFVFKGTFLARETVEYVRARNVPVVLYYPDLSFFVHGPWLLRSLPCYDFIFSSKSFAADDLRRKWPGMNAVQCLPLYFDPDVHFPLVLDERERQKYGCDVSFIGNWAAAKEPAVRAVCDALAPRYRVRIWGEGWKKRGVPRFDSCLEGSGIYGLEYTKAVRASKVNLCLLHPMQKGTSSGDQVTARTFQIPPTEAFLLHEHTGDLEQFFTPGEEIGCFRGVAGLIEQAARYLEEPAARQKIARAGRERALRSGYSSDARAEVILEKYRELRKC